MKSLLNSIMNVTGKGEKISNTEKQVDTTNVSKSIKKDDTINSSEPIKTDDVISASESIKKDDPSVVKFSDLGLSDLILKAVSDKGYEIPTPVQAKAIPAVLEGRDVMAAAHCIFFLKEIF